MESTGTDLLETLRRAAHARHSRRGLLRTGAIAAGAAGTAGVAGGGGGGGPPPPPPWGGQGGGGGAPRGGGGLEGQPRARHRRSFGTGSAAAGDGRQRPCAGHLLGDRPWGRSRLHGRIRGARYGERGVGR